MQYIMLNAVSYAMQIAKENNDRRHQFGTTASCCGPDDDAILSLINSLPSAPTAAVPAIPPKSRCSNRDYTLVLDIDETLVHCTTDASGAAEADLVLSGVSPEGDIYVRTRPNLIEFLEEAVR